MEHLDKTIKTVPTHRAGELRGLLDGRLKPQKTPALYVLFAGGNAVDKDAAASLTLNIVVVVVSRDVANQHGGSARDAAGPLAWRVAETLHGHRPCDGFAQLSLSGMDAPVMVGGYFLLPLIFSTNTFITRSK